MGRNARWLVAGLVTAAAFAVPAWVSGAVVLPSLLEDPAIRWSLASALGAVLGSLGVLWGHAFATRASTAGRTDSSVQATGERSAAVGGDNWAPVTTGDTTAPAPPTAAPPLEHPLAAGPPPLTPTAGTASATGDRAIGVGGSNSGPLSTGDQPRNPLP
ncbi:hypothetical protein [Streptomyces sp. NPDC005907]|uniref:hypothetical protein n=1 Tax=Streptomyces sp. NPDC005907 TaxID=3154571 RepID=UPI0033C4D1BE